MFEKELTPPDGRMTLSRSSGSPDSVYKSSTETDSDSSRTLNFSPDLNKTSTAFKPSQALPKFKIDEDLDSDIEWEQSFASPLQKRPPSIKKIPYQKLRSRLSLLSVPETPAPPLRSTAFSTSCNNSYSHVDDDRAYTAPKSKEHCGSCLLRPPPLSSPIATPPHKRLRALQINTVTSSRPTTTAPVGSPMGRPSPLRMRKQSPRGALFNNGGNGRRSLRASPLNAKKRPSINPYTPDRHIKSMLKIQKAKRQFNSDSGFSDDSSWLLDLGKHDSTDMDTDVDSIDINLDLDDMNTSRYKEEFCEEAVVGSGEFGTVFKCVNKLDGCVYAIKRSREPVIGRSLARVSRNEVYAEAVLGRHSHVVRYHSAWAESGYLYIQNEFCNGGSLAEEIAVHKKRGTKFTELELREILRQIAHGLKYIHALLLTHMDIKPGNIFIQYNQLVTQTPESGIEEDYIDDTEITEEVTYKIGDFGHATPVFPRHDVDEGDCRYLPKEILVENHAHMPKADIFALGLSIYQAATLMDLPKNGDKWHELRDGKLPYMTGYSSALNSIVQSMVHPNPNARPTAIEICVHPEMYPEALRTRIELTQQLDEERRKNQRLSEELQAVKEHAELRSFAAKPIRPNTRASRMVGLKVNRSKSLTNF